MTRLEHISQLLDAKVYSAEGKLMGKVAEVVASPDERFPRLQALQLRLNGNGVRWLPIEFCDLAPGEVRLRLSLEESIPYYPSEQSIWLRRDVMDKQIVDVEEHRVVRVNDLWLARKGDKLGVVGVEADFRSLSRRLGIEGAIKRIASALRLRLPARIIPWDDVERLQPAGGGIKLRVPYTKIARLHPADIADIVEQLDPAQRAEVIESLDVETAAEAISEADPEVQVAIIESLDSERASDLLEEMEPDEAADILQDLPDKRTEEILEQMEPDEAAEVKQLLEYDEETAGGLMTPEFVAISEHFTAEEAIQYLRELQPKAENVYYVYVADDEGRLTGVISLRDLIVAQPETPVSEFMARNVLSVDVHVNLEEVAQMLAKYNLLALPVVDSENRLLGTITIDDTISRVLPPERRRRLPSITKEE